MREQLPRDIPVFAKLSPDVTDIVAVASACVDAGADGLSMINTLLGMVIDPDTMRPVLAGVTGGLSGPAIRPVAVRCVWQVRAAMRGPLPTVPILGMGGIRTGLDALQFVLAGASAVQVGTAVFNDPSAAGRAVHGELAARCCGERGFARARRRRRRGAHAAGPAPMSPAAPFGARLRRAMAARGPLCVGIDPHPGLLAAWGLPDDAQGLETVRDDLRRGARRDGRRPQAAVGVLRAASARAGVAVLERALAGLRDAGALSLLDVKRGDIGSTMTAYAEAYLGRRQPAARPTRSPSARTSAPGRCSPALDRGPGHGGGVFVLALTSNPEGASVQHARRGEDSVAGAVVAGATADNAGAAPLGSVGLVVGATIGAAVQSSGSTSPGSTGRCWLPASARRARGRGPAGGLRCGAAGRAGEQQP